MQLKREWLIKFDKLTKKYDIRKIKKYIHWYTNKRIKKS